MKFNFVTFMVRDIEKSTDFYVKMVGLTVVRSFDAPVGKIVFLANAQGETMIELIESKDSDKVGATGMFFNFLVTEDLEVLREKAIKLGYEPSKVFDRGPKPDYFTITDPDGLIVEFGT